MKVSIHFSLASGSSPDLPIRMRISYDGLRLDLRTGFVCSPDKWDTDTMRMKQGCSNRYGETASKINRELSKQEGTIRELLDRYALEHTTPEPAALKKSFENAIGRKPRGRKSSLPSDTFIDSFRLFMCEYGRQAAWSSATTKNYITVLNRLEDFSFADNPTKDITTEDLSDFISELWTDGLENQSIASYLSCIKTMLRWSRKKGLYSGSIPEDFSPKLKGIGKKDVHYLEWPEFKTLLYLQVPFPSLSAIRDSFCFCCATGLRVSDCDKLKWSDVHLTSETPYIAVLTKKTTKPLIIELNMFSRAIIERQMTYDHRSSDLVFQKVAIRTRNNALKSLARSAQIDSLVRKISFSGNRCDIVSVPKYEAISTHWGRHTFVVHALRLGIPADVIMSWTGHSSYQSMKPYIAIVDEAKVENMAKFDENEAKNHAPENVPTFSAITPNLMGSDENPPKKPNVEKSLFDDISD